MKKLILTVLAMPLFLVACSDEKFDRNLNGTWEGTTQTTDEALLASANMETAAIKETVIYKFDDAKLTTYRAKNSSSTNKVEVETGRYESSDNKIVYNLDGHSCVDAEQGKLDIDKRPTSRSMTYSLSKDQNTLTINVSMGMKITLTRVSEEDAKLIDHQASNATTGCFTGGNTFKPGEVKKPTSSVAADPSVSEEAIEQGLDQIEQNQEAAPEQAEIPASEQA